MRIFKQIKQNFDFHKIDVMMYMGIILGIILLGGISVIVFKQYSMEINLSIEVANAVFIFISMIVIKENLKYGFQNNVSRKNFYISKSITGIMIVLALGIYLILLEFIVNRFDSNLILTIFHSVTANQDFSYYVSIFMYYLIITFPIMALGLCFGFVNFITTKLQKMLIYVMIFVFFAIGLPLLNLFLDGMLMNALFDCYKFVVNHKFLSLLISIAISTVISFGGYLIARKVQL